MYQLLLVDDEQSVLNALRRELSADYEIEAFTNPLEALERCRHKQFDLLIVDYKMPEMDGAEFLVKYQEIQPGSLRFMLSGQADFSALDKVINQGHIYRFIGKPWDATDLATTLAEALSQHQVLLKNQRLADDIRQKRSWQTAHDPNKIYQVLVVDDEPNVLSAIAREINARGGFYDLQLAMLNAKGFSTASAADLHFHVTTTTSPLQALEHAKNMNFDVVISDYAMPEMDGLQFFAELRKFQPEAARILFSGRADKNVLVNAINDSEIFSYLSKPWHEYTLRNAVSQAVFYHNLLRENRLLAEQHKG
jgi:response regulator RpfG family c-di-GMP phosphodiesterase